MAVDIIHDYTGRGETGSARVRIRPQPGGETPEVSGKKGFAELVKEFAGDVNRLQFQAGHAIDMLATGEAADVHQVMVAVEEAGIALDLMLEIRNRVLEGYQELIRMQV